MRDPYALEVNGAVCDEVVIKTREVDTTTGDEFEDVVNFKNS